MCSCVPGEVLRFCSAANPADIPVYVPSITVYTRLKKNSILYFMPVFTQLFVHLYVYYILLTPHEYYMVLLALAINAASKPRLAASALHTASFIAQCSVCTFCYYNCTELKKNSILHFRLISC